MPKPVIFPRDENSHKCSIEWWYFNGHLKGANGRNYSYMNCLFKARIEDFMPLVKKTSLKSPMENFYFSHSIITDINTGKSYPQINYVSLLSKDSFSKKLLFINYTNPLCLSSYFNNEIVETDPFEYRMKTENMELEMISRKKPMLENGIGFVNLKPEKTYYYSLTDLETKGTININGKEIPVKGKSWFDHQWADVITPNKWNWISIQLDDNTDIVCFEYENPKRKTRMATISYSNNRQESFHNPVLEPTEIKWKSQKSGVSYPLGWRIEIPERKIFLKAEPMAKNQEMLFGTMKYWEGPMKITGTKNGKKISGQGFLELVGRPGQRFELKMLRNALRIIKK